MLCAMCLCLFQARFPAEMDLGDMFISLAYVDRQIERDREEETDAARVTVDGGNTALEEEEEEDEEWWDRERGVSGAMSRVFDVQVSLLLVIPGGGGGVVVVVEGGAIFLCSIFACLGWSCIC